MEVKIFENVSCGSVRVVMIENNPWFVARDIATCLGYVDTVDAVKTHCKKAIIFGEQMSANPQFTGGGVSPSPVDSGSQGFGNCSPLDPQTKLIPEADVYRLAMRSKLPSAEAFQDWVCEEVLPSIRKTGMYTPGTYLEALEQCVALEKARLAECAEKEKAQAALQAEQSAHLDTQYDLSVTRHELIELNDRYSEFTAQGSVNDMRSAYDMQAVLLKYFDTGKRRGDKGFWWYMSGFMHTYCHGGIRNNSYSVPGLNCALPGELTGHVYQIAKRDNTTVFDRRAWADVTAYFKSHKDSLKDLPYIGYAAR